jgi:superfamily I DNA and/or RNA helicase
MVCVGSRLAANARRCILVGDPRQLPATSHLMTSGLARLYERSMFERYEHTSPTIFAVSDIFFRSASHIKVLTNEMDDNCHVA